MRMINGITLGDTAGTRIPRVADGSGYTAGRRWRWAIRFDNGDDAMCVSVQTAAYRSTSTRIAGIATRSGGAAFGRWAGISGIQRCHDTVSLIIPAAEYRADRIRIAGIAA